MSAAGAPINRQTLRRCVRCVEDLLNSEARWRAIEWAIDDNPAKILKAGDTFYEPTRCLHRVSRNPSKKDKTRILAVVLHPAVVKDIVIPEKDKK